MNYGLLVVLPDGSFVRKAPEEMSPDDRVVLDGPDSFSSIHAKEAELDAEIEAAGGLEAWMAGAPAYRAA